MPINLDQIFRTQRKHPYRAALRSYESAMNHMGTLTSPSLLTNGRLVLRAHLKRTHNYELLKFAFLF